MINVTKEIPGQTPKYSVVTPWFLVLVLNILIHFYFVGEKPKKILRSNNGEPIVPNKPQGRSIPVVTYWFPFTIPLLDGIITLFWLRKSGVAFFDELQSKFGKVYSLPIGHQKVLVINDVNMVQNLLTSKDPQHLNKPNELYGKIFINSFRDGLVNSSFHIWSSHRKILNNCFSYKSLQNYLKSMNTHGQGLISNLCNANPNNDKIADASFINNAIHYHLEKITSDIVMGSASMSDEVAAEYSTNLKIVQQSIFGVLLIPLLKFPPFRYIFPNINNQREAFNFLETFFKNIVKKCSKYYVQKFTSNQMEPASGEVVIGVKPHRCIIEEMLYQGATEKEITDQVATFMIAGTKSTSVSIQMLMNHLALNPDYQSRCREEIDQLINLNNNNKLDPQNYSNDFNFNINDLANLKFLERCILESARRTPVFPIFGRKLESPLKISHDLELPPGTNVAVPLWMIHRDPDNFSNPEKFDPDRFLPENVKKRHPYSFVPFSSGPRNCIAYKMAIMEIKVIVAGILRNFEITSTDKVEDVKLHFEVTIRPERNYNIVLKRRQFQRTKNI